MLNFKYTMLFTTYYKLINDDDSHHVTNGKITIPDEELDNIISYRRIIKSSEGIIEFLCCLIWRLSVMCAVIMSSCCRIIAEECLCPFLKISLFTCHLYLEVTIINRCSICCYSFIQNFHQEANRLWYICQYNVYNSNTRFCNCSQVTTKVYQQIQTLSGTSICCFVEWSASYLKYKRCNS